MKEYELDSRFSREQVWGRLLRAGDGVHMYKAETRYYEVKLKPLRSFKFDAVLDVWILPKPDEFGQIPSDKLMKRERRLCFRGSIKPTETGSKITGSFRMENRALLFYIFTILVAVGRNALKVPAYRTIRGVFTLLLVSVLAVLVCAAIRSRLRKDTETAQQQWLIRFIEVQLLRP